MSCKIATAPINISSGVREPCQKMCDLQYNYGHSSCTVTNKSTYLDISCYDGYNTIDFGITGSVNPVSVRLYRPSLNSYDGFKADAELIITHTGGGRNLYICIPVNSYHCPLCFKTFTKLNFCLHSFQKSFSNKCSKT